MVICQLYTHKPCAQTDEVFKNTLEKKKTSVIVLLFRYPETHIPKEGGLETCLNPFL